MAQGRIGLGKLQLGKETTPGTSVPATTVWRGAASFISDDRIVKIVEEMVGILGGTNRSYIPELLAGLSLAETEATFEQLPYLLASGWGGPVSGTEDGSDTDVYIYSTNVPTTSTASMTGKTYSWRGGDDAEVELLDLGFCSEFTIKGAVREAVKMSGVIMGRQAAVSSFTGAIALPTVEECLVQSGKFYLDATSGSFGSTQVSNQIVGFEVSCKTGLKPQFSMDGQLYFSQILASDPEITGKVTFLHDSAVGGASGEKSKWRSQTPRLMQIKVEGSTFGTPGETYTKKSLIINLPILWTKFSALENQDGATICSGEFTSKYDETEATSGQFIVVNALSALS